MMKRVYYKTNLSYLIPGLICIIWLYYIAGLEDELPILRLFLVAYVMLLFGCTLNTLKNRKALDEIIENGRCVNAGVKRLIKVSYEYNWGPRLGGMYIDCYQIEAEYLDHTYISDPILKRYRNKIPKEVKIYSYMGRDCFVWEPHKGKRIDFEIVDGKDLKGKTSRSVLAMFTVLFTSVFCLTYIVLLLGWMGILT